ncbi:MAG: hypothetical protein IT488_10905 [Gammaproteobacteria bacterium]|nr:hypothetical protein [Gammaproteobacteria bacterium]
MYALDEQINDEILAEAKRSLAGSLNYLLTMEQMFDRDTRRLYELIRPKVAAVLKDKRDMVAYDDLQLYGRAFIRAMFAHVEGVTYLLRQVVLWAHDRNELELSETELARLSETYKFNTFKDNFQLGFNHFAATLGSTYQPNKTDPRYQSFLRAIKVRNAITHPKFPAGFGISGDALRDAQLGLLWFHESFQSLLGSLSGAR